jgi:hypothetical protein
MDLPRQYAYNPQWRIILFCFAPAIVVLVRARFHWIGVALAIPFVAFALVLAMRRLIFPRFIKLEQEALSLLGGFLRLRATKISYADIELTQEIVHKSKIFRMTAFRLRTKERKFEIIATMLPDMASYVAIRDFVNSRVTPKEKTVQPIEAGKYCFRCSYEGNGEIYNSNGEIVWRVKTLHRRPHYPYGLFRLPDFVVNDKGEKELFRIKLERKWALAQFVMVENGVPVCTLKQRSILRNKFRLDFSNGQKWVFREPLFTVNFGGWSETGEKIRVRLRSHNIWYVLIDAKVDSPQLVAALAFIHRERLRFN